MSGFQKGVIYEQIKDHVLEHSGLKVSSLYIPQVKRKCGLDVGQSSLFREFYLSFSAESSILEMKNIRRCRMAISYNRLWKRLIDHDLSKTDMMHRANISTNVLARLGKGAPVSMESMEKICKVLNCNIGDVMEFVPDNENGGKDA